MNTCLIVIELVFNIYGTINYPPFAFSRNKFLSNRTVINRIYPRCFNDTSRSKLLSFVLLYFMSVKIQVSITGIFEDKCIRTFNMNYPNLYLLISVENVFNTGVLTSSFAINKQQN